MQLNTYLSKKMPYLAAFSLVFGLYSCGSYQYVGVDNDGIYSTTPRTVQYEDAVVETQNNNSNYYQNYFKNKALETQYISSGDEIFTDIDSYQSGNYVQNDSLTNNYQGYAGWGQTNANVTINYIDNGFWNDPFINGWGWNAGWNSWNNWGWNNRGWNRWNTWGGWNHWNNWGWNGGFYDPFWGPQFYGGVVFNTGWGYYGNGFYGNNFYGNNGYYNRRNVSYSASRRGSNYNGNAVGMNNSNYSTSRRGNMTTNTTTGSESISKYSTSRRGSVNTVSTESVNSRQYTPNTSRAYYPNTQRRTVSNTAGVNANPSRVNTNTPAVNSTTRSSSTSTVRRSSGTIQTPARSSGSNSVDYSRQTAPSSNNSTYTPSRSSSSGSSGGSSSGGRRSSGSSSGGGGRRG